MNALRRAVAHTRTSLFHLQPLSSNPFKNKSCPELPIPEAVPATWHRFLRGLLWMLVPALLCFPGLCLCSPGSSWVPCRSCSALAPGEQLHKSYLQSFWGIFLPVWEPGLMRNRWSPSSRNLLIRFRLENYLGKCWVRWIAHPNYEIRCLRSSFWKGASATQGRADWDSPTMMKGS